MLLLFKIINNFFNSNDNLMITYLSLKTFTGKMK